MSTSEPTDRMVRRLGREVRFWRGLGAVVAIAAAVAWAGGLPSAQARQARARRDAPPARADVEYAQAQAVYTRAAEVINEWESRGWAVFQVIPVHPANPGVGGPMTVAILFRRPAK